MTREELEHVVDECLYHLLPLKSHKHLVDTIMCAADAYADSRVLEARRADAAIGLHWNKPVPGGRL